MGKKKQGTDDLQGKENIVESSNKGDALQGRENIAESINNRMTGCFVNTVVSGKRRWLCRKVRYRS